VLEHYRKLDQRLPVAANMPPRDPNDEEEEEDKDEEDEEQSKEPPVVREPDEE
jgi:hypothetical protein